MKPEPLEDWDTCEKTTCVMCDFDVRRRFFDEHLWIAHGIVL